MQATLDNEEAAVLAAWSSMKARLAASAGLLGCADSAVGPADEVPLQWVGFQTPTDVSLSDTLRVSMQAVMGCGVVPGTDLRLERGRVSIRAWATALDRTFPFASAALLHFVRAAAAQPHVRPHNQHASTRLIQDPRGN